MTASRPSDNSVSSGRGTDARTVLGTVGTDERASTAVVDLLASIDDVSPCRTDFVLHDYVDPEALDELIDGGKKRSSALQISFQVDNYTIVVCDDGAISATWTTP